MSIKVYDYKNCSTCQKALKLLTAKGLEFQRVPIVEQPPSVSELRRMSDHLTAAGGSIKTLFNTSGAQYRELKIPEKLAAGMSDEAIFELLSQNGKLIKRPFLLTSKGGTVGFDPKIWETLIG
jgi:arsenate reductase (glutaredoxin)